MANKPAKNSTSSTDQFVPPDWSGDPSADLEYLRQYAEQTIHSELEWYKGKKPARSVTSRALRFSSVILSILGGLAPILISVFSSRPDWPWLNTFANVRLGQLGYLLLAIAAGLLLLDKFFGYSTGWMRYIVAMQSIERSREEFRLDWVKLSRRFLGTAPGTPDQAEAIELMIDRVRSIVVEVKEHSAKETQAWIKEFQSNLARFERDLKAQMEASRPGGIDVEISDGDKADTAIELSLDGMIADKFSGTAGSIGNVTPGLHRVAAKAQEAGRDYSAAAMVDVLGGQIAKVKLTLNIP